MADIATSHLDIKNEQNLKYDIKIRRAPLVHDACEDKTKHQRTTSRESDGAMPLPGGVASIVVRVGAKAAGSLC